MQSNSVALIGALLVVLLVSTATAVSPSSLFPAHLSSHHQPDSDLDSECGVSLG